MESKVFSKNILCSICLENIENNSQEEIQQN